MDTKKSHIEIVHKIQNEVKDYLIKHKIKSLIIGISGGFDSGFNAAILKPICEELNIPLIGRYIHIDSNKPEERKRADKIGEAFCSNYKPIDLTEEYKQVSNKFMLLEGVKTWEARWSYECLGLNEKQYKIALGNIKCRLRMIYLYNMAALYQGIVVDNDNKTEHMLGFWTIGGDIGDITPLANYFKTDLYEIAKSYLKTLSSNKEKEALQSVIDAIPTDGLGVSNSDVEQFGVDSYTEVDDTLKYISSHGIDPKEDTSPFNDEKKDKIWTRWRNSEFKRNHPYRILL